MNMSIDKRILASALAFAGSIGLVSPEIAAQSIGGGGYSVESAAAVSYVSYKNLRTGLCLSNDITGKLFAQTCSDTNTNQDWTVSADSTGFIVKNRRTGYCLEMYGTTLTAAVCRPILFQRWFTIRNSTYVVKFYNYGESTCFYNHTGATLTIGQDCVSSTLPYLWQELR